MKEKKARSGRPWTQDEELLLEDIWPKYTLNGIAKKLERTVCAVRSKAARLKLGSHIHSKSEITFCQLLYALGLSCSYTWYSIRFKKNGLPIVYKKTLSKSYAMVNIDEFWKWAENNKHLVNFAHFEKGMLGEEPDWVDLKRSNDMKNPSRIDHNKPWTKREDQLLIDKVKSNRYTYPDLAAEFNRTQAAIKRRLMNLKVPYRPLPLDTNRYWTDEETKIVLELYNKGFDANTIAKMTNINKTEMSIMDRIALITRNSKV